VAPQNCVFKRETFHWSTWHHKKAALKVPFYWSTWLHKKVALKVSFYWSTWLHKKSSVKGAVLLVHVAP